MDKRYVLIVVNGKDDYIGSSHPSTETDVIVVPECDVIKMAEKDYMQRQGVGVYKKGVRTSEMYHKTEPSYRTHIKENWLYELDQDAIEMHLDDFVSFDLRVRVETFLNVAKVQRDEAIKDREIEELARLKAKYEGQC